MNPITQIFSRAARAITGSTKAATTPTPANPATPAVPATPSKPATVKCEVVAKAYLPTAGSSTPRLLKPGEIVDIDTASLPVAPSGKRALPTALCPVTDPSLAARRQFFKKHTGGPGARVLAHAPVEV